MSESDGADAVVESLELPLATGRAVLAAQRDVVILPLRIDARGGVYGEATIELLKAMRSEGLSVDYLDPPDSRRFEVKKSDPASAVMWVYLAIASGITYDVVKATVIELLGRFGQQTVDLQYAEVDQDGRSIAWRVRGRGQDVVQVLSEMRKQ